MRGAGNHDVDARATGSIGRGLKIVNQIEGSTASWTVLGVLKGLRPFAAIDIAANGRNGRDRRSLSMICPGRVRSY